MIKFPSSSSSFGSSESSFLPVAVSLGAASSVLLVQLLTSADPIGKCWVAWKQLRKHEDKLSCNTSVNQGIDDYQALQASEDASTRNAAYQSLVNSYYDLATVFYEWGWGDCFHFSSRFRHESFWESIRRHEYQLAAQLQLTTGTSLKVLDVGCGIGGPLRNLARFFQKSVHITGVTLNPYQVERGNELCQQQGLQETAHLVQGDFMKLQDQFGENTFDAVYAIEATCHAPDRVACYQQIYKVLKPGGVFACYEWCMTDKYDPNNQEHLRLKKDMELGNGLPDITTTRVCRESLQQAGFDVLSAVDVAEHSTQHASIRPWYEPLLPSWNPLTQRFQFNWLGSIVINVFIHAVELIRLAPKGTVKTQKVLQAGGFALRDAGKEGIFTVAYLMVGRKPLK